MAVLMWMIPISLLLGFGFVVAFIWAVDQGQLEGLDDQARKILLDDEVNNE